ncbi:MAG: hypothetical protein ABIG95_01565 [Candidatus Woesearchaeota archaeon]
MNYRQRLGLKIGLGALVFTAGAASAYMATKQEVARVFSEPVTTAVRQVDELMLTKRPDIYIDTLTDYIVDNPAVLEPSDVSGLVQAIDTADLVDTATRQAVFESSARKLEPDYVTDVAESVFPNASRERKVGHFLYTLKEVGIEYLDIMKNKIEELRK